jgi:site-specific recombinase XerD
VRKCWYLPLSESFYQQIVIALQALAIINHEQLKSYLQKRKQVAATSVQTGSFTTNVTERGITPKQSFYQLPPSSSPVWKLGKENLQALEQFVQQLKLKAYSEATMHTYRGEFLQLLRVLQNRPVHELTAEDVKRYMVYAMEEEGIKENTAHSRLNALKFYFEQVLGREKMFWEIPRPKKPIQLPKFFNQDEIASIIKAAGNLKHKTMLMLAYSGGLRVSEVVSIKTRNIDSKRMCILIERAKGKKDRMVALSPVLLVLLREYWKKYKPLKEGYLFEGQAEGSHYSSRSLQLVLAAAKKKAGIMKPGSVHALRHSFATHLLDKGTDVTMIMKLLGHNDLKTTLRYLHVTNRDMLQVMSPLDDLKLE